MACLCSNEVLKPGRRQPLVESDVVLVEATKSGTLNCYESIEGNSGEVRQYDRYYFNLRSKYKALAAPMEDGHLAGVGPSTSTTSAWPLVMPTLVVPHRSRSDAAAALDDVRRLGRARGRRPRCGRGVGPASFPWLAPSGALGSHSARCLSQGNDPSGS